MIYDSRVGSGVEYKLDDKCSESLLGYFESAKRIDLPDIAEHCGGISHSEILAQMDLLRDQSLVFEDDGRCVSLVQTDLPG